MADLDDLDTTNIGPYAYWNALDHGAGSVDPVAVLEMEDVNSWDSGDNGIEGTITIVSREGERGPTGGDLVANFRVKTDGWHMVWLDSPDTFKAVTSTNHGGPNFDGNGTYDLINDWWDPEQIGSRFPRTTFGDCINTIREITSDGNETFNQSDVGIYSFEYPEATQMHIQYEVASEFSGTLRYSSDITRHYHAIACAGSDMDWPDDINVYCDGFKVFDHQGLGVYDAIDEGLYSDPDVYYDHSGEYRSANDYYNASVTHVWLTS